MRDVKKSCEDCKHSKKIELASSSSISSLFSPGYKLNFQNENLICNMDPNTAIIIGKYHKICESFEDKNKKKDYKQTTIFDFMSLDNLTSAEEEFEEKNNGSISENLVTFYINKDLAKKQHLSEETIKEIEKIYEELAKLFTETEKDLENGNLNSKYVFYKVQHLEFKLQELWGFEKDELKHTWTFKIPGCNCPTMDNRDAFGYRRIFREDCPIHGFIVKESQEKERRKNVW